MGGYAPEYVLPIWLVIRIFTANIFKTLTLPMQRFGVKIHLIDKDLILLTFKRKNAYEKENDFINNVI